MKTAREVMRVAGEMVESGFGLEDIRRLDREFIAGRISPGGSGDLLAVTYFMHSLEQNVALQKNIAPTDYNMEGAMLFMD